MSSYDVFHKKLKPKHVFASSLPTFHSSNNKILNDVLVSHSNKRVKETQQTHYNMLSEKRFLDFIQTKIHSRNNLGETKMDNFKKQQCFVTLRRLMLNPDGKDFKNAMDSKRLARFDSNDNTLISGQPLMEFETMKLKLEKGLYLTTNQFASDVRVLFYNAIMLHHMSHKIQRIAMRLSELFEMKWKYLEEKWIAEKQNNKEEKPMEEAKENVTKVCGARNKRKFEFDAKLSTKKVKKEHVVETILAAQRNLFGCNEVSLERKKEREAAKLMIQNMKRTVFIDDNLNSFKEFERLCGRSLQDCNKVNPIRKFAGLVLKDEFMGVTDLNEEKFLNRGWEEGEIIILD